MLKTKRRCSAPGCASLDTIAKGYCSKHYRQMRRYGKLLAPEDEHGAVRPFCSVRGCGRPTLKTKNPQVVGLCHFHRTRQKNGISLDRPEIKQYARCQVKECEDPPRVRGYCSRHSQQLYLHGRLTRQSAGRPTPEQRAWAMAQRKAGSPATAVAKALGVTIQTIYNYERRQKQGKGQ